MVRRVLAITVLLTVFLAACTAIAGGPGPAETVPQLTYTVSACQEHVAVEELPSWARVEVTATEGAIRIQQNLSYVCCATVQLELEQSGNVLKIVETNVGEMCRCMCGYVVDARIEGLRPGRYTVQVWGVRFEEMEPELLGEQVVEL
ncbi:MAG: hypothetical protein K6V36_04260 [Anaerolineae bacterium]|nr:hypothetical protein [Anaerolineae bacterium]